MAKQSSGKKFDAIVIGSGPGGATIAKELSKREKSVLILERGDNSPLKESFRVFLSIFNSVSVGDNLTTTRAFTTGGTTALYFAAVDFPPLDFFRSLGIDLSKDMEEVKMELPIAPLSDELLGAQAIRVRESAIELGHHWKKRMMLIDQSKCASGYSYEAKWNARSYVLEAIGGGATLINQATVRKVLVKRNKAIGVEYEIRNGKNASGVYRAYGRKIILAAGALASPIILRNSGIKNVANRGFYCTPSFGLIGTVPGLKGGDLFGGAMGTNLDGDIVFGDANVSRTFYKMMVLAKRKFIRFFSHSKSIGVGVMMKDGLGGELRDDGGYYKQFSEEESKKLKDSEEIAREIIRNAGGRHIFNSGLGSAHAGGLVRIKEHLDEKLETEYSNLHVCDGSVIPENTVFSPTLTLICLGKYLARHLVSVL